MKEWMNENCLNERNGIEKAWNNEERSGIVEKFDDSFMEGWLIS